MFVKRKKLFFGCFAALALLLVFSGCSNSSNSSIIIPPSIQITVSGIDLNKMPHHIEPTQGPVPMAGFTVSLIPETGPVSINDNVGPMDIRTILNGPVAESARPFFMNPPSEPSFDLTFTVELSAGFNGSGNYVVVFGASNDYTKYDSPGVPYSKGKMFITKNPETPTTKGTRAISNGVVIPWIDFLDNPSPEGDGMGYSATQIAAMFSP